MADYQWKPLTDEKKFEDLVNDLCSAKYGLEFQIYGRKGQKQYGIDGSALTNDKEHILYQCKNKMVSRTNRAIQSELLKDLENETTAMIKEFIENKKYKVKKFIFANSFKQDTKLQDRAIELSQTSDFIVIVWSWDEISEMLEEYTDIAKKYYPQNFQNSGSVKTIKAKNNFENLVNNGTIFFNVKDRDEKEEILEKLRIKYNNNVDNLRKAIFTYYSSRGTNFDNFRRATTFDELFDILQREKDYLYCILKEIGQEVDDAYIDCEALKAKSESSKEINKIILKINSSTNSLKDCQISGYIGYSSESFDSIEEEATLEFTDSNHSQILSQYIDSILQGRSCARVIELQLLLPTQLFKLDFKIENEKIRVVKRLLYRIENYQQLEIDEIRYWQRNSSFYHSCKSQKISQDSICSLDKNDLSDFREVEGDNHICVISDECLSYSIDDIYSYGITIVLYPYNNSCKIINEIDFQNRLIENIKGVMFKFIKKNQGVHLMIMP